MVTLLDVKEMIEEYGFTVRDDVSTLNFVETADGFTIEYTQEGKYIFYPNDTWIHEIIGKWMSEPQSEKEIRQYLKSVQTSIESSKVRARKKTFECYFHYVTTGNLDVYNEDNEDDSVTQHLGHTPVWRQRQLGSSLTQKQQGKIQLKNKWAGIISVIKRQLPSGYEYVRYVGPVVPVKDNNQTTAYLQFGVHKRQPIIIADITKSSEEGKWVLDTWRSPDDFNPNA